MMKSIVEEKLVSFKSLEQKIFAYVCELGREITRIMLENYDVELSEERDRSRYRDKGKRSTTIKTVYGEVTYARRVYQTKLENGRNAHVYLLDEAMHMEKIGLLSTNLAEKIAMIVTESPYRVTAETISETCGQSISHGGVWNLVQRLGERISKEEEYAVKQMESGQAEGQRWTISTVRSMKISRPMGWPVTAIRRKLRNSFPTRRGSRCSLTFPRIWFPGTGESW